MTNILSRRDAIKKISLLIGASVASTDVVKAWENLTIINPHFSITVNDEILIADIAERIIPTTDTPGAKAANVPAFILKMVADCYEMPKQDLFFEGLKALDSEAQKAFGRGFSECTEGEQIERLTAVEKTGSEFWKIIKHLTCLGYFTSEIGCTQALRYVAVPGKYEEIDYKKGDKSWAT